MIPMSTENETIVYTCEAYRNTLATVARKFSESFPERREVDWIDGRGNFQLVNGTATYRIDFVKGTPGRTVATYRVVRLG